MHALCLIQSTLHRLDELCASSRKERISQTRSRTYDNRRELLLSRREDIGHQIAILVPAAKPANLCKGRGTHFRSQRLVVRQLL